MTDTIRWGIIGTANIAYKFAQGLTAEVMHCIRAGKLESELMPLDETLELMTTLDAIRDQWDLVYPMEEGG